MEMFCVPFATVYYMENYIIFSFLCFQIGMAPRKQSWPQLKYPSYRDATNKSIDLWLEGKRLDDGADNLWRVHDNLYDLTDFVKQHPGGSMWLNLTKVSTPCLYYKV